MQISDRLILNAVLIITEKTHKLKGALNENHNPAAPLIWFCLKILNIETYILLR